MAFIAARMSVLRGRPPGSAAGINGASRAHSASVRSLGNRKPSRRYVLRCSFVHIPVHPAAPNRHGESSFRRSDNELLGQALSGETERLLDEGQQRGDLRRLGMTGEKGPAQREQGG